MTRLLIADARVLTLVGPPRPRRGDAMRALGILPRADVLLHDDRIEAVGPNLPRPAGATIVDAAGRVLMPGFVDCHTHACWAGQRFDEFDMKLAGAAYLDILAAGGGIMSTVRAVRAADVDDLASGLALRLERMLALGTTTAEVKSGYGLRTDAELRMLLAVRAAAERSPMTVVPTFLGAHAIDRDRPNFIDETIEETLPAVVDAFPGITCDAYCETGAWSVEDTCRLFRAAAARGCPLRVHTDQFHSLGMTRAAIELGASSVDHLEAVDPADLPRLAASDTIAVALPCSGFHLDGRYAPGRAIVDAGAALAIATNYNPGSAPTPSMPFAIALACRELGLTPAEAIVASTVNGACVLGLGADRGQIAPGARADVQLLDSTDERELAYEFATPGPRLVVSGGRIVARRAV
ncbi:MAG: imidazolonepropionase [Phycisphaerales bacterium]|nr:imidazolonepropionase [Phycisphaerales bacterium]